MKKFTFALSLLLGISIVWGSAIMIANSATKTMAQAAAPLAATPAPTAPELAEPPAADGTALPDPDVVSADQAVLDAEALANAPVVEDTSDPTDFEYEYIDAKGGKEALPPIAEFTEAIYPRSGPIIPSTEYFALAGPPIFRVGNPPNTRGQDPCPAAP